jgi:hypothetical protein
MRRGHLSDIAALEVALGESRDAGAAAHAAECAECGTRVDAVREGQRLAAEATVREPGDVFWHALHARIKARVEERAVATHHWHLRLRAAWSLAAVAVIIVVAAVWSVQRTQAPPAAAIQTAWVPLESPDDDAGLALVGEILPAVEDEGQTWAGCGSCLEGLTDQERQAMVETLRQEIGRQS